jgi:hypothetical protein
LGQPIANDKWPMAMVNPNRFGFLAPGYIRGKSLIPLDMKRHGCE